MVEEVKKCINLRMSKADVGVLILEIINITSLSS